MVALLITVLIMTQVLRTEVPFGRETFKVAREPNFIPTRLDNVVPLEKIYMEKQQQLLLLFGTRRPSELSTDDSIMSSATLQDLPYSVVLKPIIATKRYLNVLLFAQPKRHLSKVVQTNFNISYF